MTSCMSLVVFDPDRLLVSRPLSRGVGGVRQCGSSKGAVDGLGMEQISWGGGQSTTKRVLSTRFVTYLMGLPH